MSDAEEMAELLTYASYAKVAKALRVSRNAVTRWAHGEDVTPYRVHQVRDLLRPAPVEPPAPAWVERIIASLMIREQREGVTSDELVRAEAAAAAYLAVSRRGPPRRGGGGAGGAADA